MAGGQNQVIKVSYLRENCGFKVIKVEDEEDEQGDTVGPLPSPSSPSGGATRRVSWGRPPTAGSPRLPSGLPRPILVVPAGPVASRTRRAMSEPPESLVATVERKRLAVATKAHAKRQYVGQFFYIIYTV